MVIKVDQDSETRDIVGGETEPRSAGSSGQLSSEPEVMSKVGGCIDGIRGYSLPVNALWDVFVLVMNAVYYTTFKSDGFLIENCVVGWGVRCGGSLSS